MNPDRHHNALNQGDRLHWYEIERILGHGGFGITYLALDTNLNHKVAIKEYLPVQFATRATTGEVKPISDKDVDMFEWGKKRFLDEARTLFPFKHPNIVRVLSFFEFNETGYIVMEYVEGVDLADLIKAGEPFSEGELLGIINPILEGLSQVHEQGFIHRDIKPRNIVIREDGSPVLIDFGSARQALGEQTHTLTSLVTPGYSPLEQYHGASGNQGPWTDIYALGATLYAAATGRAPIDSMMRNAALTDNKEDPYQSLLTIVGDKYSRSFLVAIDHAMRFAASQRPQTLAEWADELSGEHTTRLADEQITATPDYLDREPVLQGGKPVGQVPLEPEKPRVNKGHKQVVILLVLLAIGVFTYPQWVNIPTDLGTNLEPVLKDERMVTDKTDQESASVDVIPLEPPVSDTPADDVSSDQRIETVSAAKPKRPPVANINGTFSSEITFTRADPGIRPEWYFGEAQQIRVRLEQRGENLAGFIEGARNGRIEGSYSGNEVNFRFNFEDSAGEISQGTGVWFVSRDGNKMVGKWFLLEQNGVAFLEGDWQLTRMN